MIFFDTTKTGTVKHRSGLARLSERLRREMGGTHAGPWTEARASLREEDWFVTSELFSEGERPGFTAFLRSHRCRTAAVFADAIPVKHPHITWPHSVARHPHYLKMLAEFDRVWAISRASRDELLEYWAWLGLERTPPVECLPLGADFDRSPRVRGRASGAAGVELSMGAGFLCVGILEPRKNQMFLLDVCSELWDAGLRFPLHVVGRINPHFGKRIAARLRALSKRYPGLRYHEAADDSTLAQLYATARATVFPTIAEGCGLPLLESLWRGVPCVCSDLPVLRENADGGGCLAVAVNDRAGWGAALRRLLNDQNVYQKLRDEVVSRDLPTWSQTAAVLRNGLENCR